MGRGKRNHVSVEKRQADFIQPEKATPGSSFAVKARRLEIVEHENADALELAKVDDYVAIVEKGKYKTGDLALYIPEAAILPDQVISDLGLEGRLAGGSLNKEGKAEKNRVKAIRLRGVLSQGLIYRPDGIELEEGKDYSEELGINKWAPPIPVAMAGDVKSVPTIRSYTSIENIKKFPLVMKPGEEVVFTEKLHGTCTITSLLYTGNAEPEFCVSSKGNAARGRSLKRNIDADSGQEKNAYWRMADKYSLEEKMRKIAERYPGKDIYIFGETLGVQDLRYGLNKGELDFRGFDIKVGDDFLDFEEQQELFKTFAIDTVPVLYKGPYDKEKIEELANGKEQFTGSEEHLREGGVLRPLHERRDEKLGRVILKVISPDYLLRHNATEYE